MIKMAGLCRCALWVFALMWFGCGVSLAQTYPAPQGQASSHGDYTVTYVPYCGGASLPHGSICMFTNLQEKLEPSGSWTTVDAGGSMYATGEKSFVSKPAGTYSYRVHVGACHPQYVCHDDYSSTISVSVSDPPLRDDILTQLDYQYEVRQGDFDANGKTDFYIKKTSGGDALNGVIEEIILQQASSGATFSAIVPTSGQSATASGWPVSSSVELVLEDINVDGFVDVVLTDVSSVVSGASNQIVYAPAQLAVAEPLGVRAVDASLKKFVGNSLDYFVNPDYFIDNVPIYYYQVWIWYAYCDPYGFPGLESTYWDYFSGCYLDYVYLDGYYADFSVFSQEAVAIFANEWSAENSSISWEDASDTIADAVEAVLDVPLGAWPMEEELGSTGEHTDPIIRRGLEVFWAILGVGRANAEEVDTDEAGSQERRLEPQKIYVTIRRVCRVWHHTALEYVPQYAPPHLPIVETFIGRPQGAGTPCIGNKLLAETNYVNDVPRLMMTIGVVDPPSGKNEFSYWATDLYSAHNHYDGLQNA